MVPTPRPRVSSPWNLAFLWGGDLSSLGWL